MQPTQPVQFTQPMQATQPAQPTLPSPAMIPAEPTTPALSATPALPTTAALPADRGAADDARRRPRPPPSRRRPPTRRRRRADDAHRVGDGERPSTGRRRRVFMPPRPRRGGSRRRDHLRDAVAGHRDAVQRVGGLHRALLVGDDDELRAVRERAQEREEAVDVEVVERGLDLVEDVERARPGEEDGEQERERGQRLLAAGEQREALGRLARGRDLDLDAELVLGRLLLVDSAPRPRLSAPPSTGRGPASSRTSRSAPRPPGKRWPTTSSKFLAAAASNVSSNASLMRRSVSRIRPVSSRSAVSRSWRWRSSSSTCSSASLYSCLRERVDGAELLAAALQALDPGVQAARARSSASGASDGSGGRPSFVASRVSSASASCGVVARLLGADLAAGDLLAVLLDAGVDARLLGGALAQLGGELLARGAVGGELGLERPRRRVAIAALRGLQRGGEPLGDRASAPRRARAGGARARAAARARPGRAAARSTSRCSVAIAASTCARALGARALVGRGAPLLDHPARVALGLGGLVARARRGAGLAVDRVARRVGLGDLAPAPPRPRRARRARPAPRPRPRLTSASRRLRSLSTRSSPPAETCRSSRVAGDHTRPSRVTATPRKPGSSAVDVVDDPDVGEQRGGERARRRRRTWSSERARRRGAGGDGGRRRGWSADGERRRAGERAGCAAARCERRRRRRSGGGGAQRRGASGAAGTISAAPPSLPARSSRAAPAARSGATAARRRGPSAAASASS